MNNKLGKLLAMGRTAVVYKWKPNEVIKVFHDWVTEEDVLYEAKLSKIIYESGLPVPWVGDILKINGQFGITFQMINGTPMNELFNNTPEIIKESINTLSSLHADIHEMKTTELPKTTDRLKKKILSVNELGKLRDAVIYLLSTLQNDSRICHGDFHPGNVIISNQNHIVIDWMDATSGNPCADVARTSLLLTTAYIPDSIKFMKQILKKRFEFNEVYLEQYFNRHPARKAEFSNWFTINAAARMAEGIQEEQETLIQIVKNGVN